MLRVRGRAARWDVPVVQQRRAGCCMGTALLWNRGSLRPGWAGWGLTQPLTLASSVMGENDGSCSCRGVGGTRDYTQRA